MVKTARKLHNISIKGFKSIKECSVGLNDINILIGANGAGKSNFISAFALLQSILDKELQMYVAQNGMNSLLYNGITETDYVSMNFDFGTNSYGFELIPTDDNRLIFKKEYFEFKGTESPISSSKGSYESNWEEGVHNLMDHYVKPVLNERPWKVYHFHDTSRTSKVKQLHNVDNNVSLNSDAGNLAAFLLRLKNNHPQNYRYILDVVKLVAPYISDFVLEPSDANGNQIGFRWKKKGLEDSFNISQMSDGTIRFICLATLLLQPRVYQPDTIIIDEPELGLHPYGIVLFADMVRNVSKNVQIIISTQSAEMLNEFDAEDIIVVETDEKEGTSFNRLDVDKLETWLEDDYMLGELWAKNLFGGRP